MREYLLIAGGVYMQENKLYQETIISKLVQAIVTEQSVQTIKLEQNTTIQGRTGTHEVDVYWEFTDGEITYKLVIQTRDWNKTVGNNELFRLLSILRDIPGQTAGACFTQPVYQKVTKELARDVGITLYELLLPMDEHIWEPIIRQVQLQVDAEWAKAEKERLGLGDQQVQLGGDPKSMFIYDANGNCLDSVQGLFNEYCKQSRQAGKYDRQTITHQFRDEYLQTNDEQFPMLKLDRVTFDLEFFDAAEVQGEEMLGTILASVLRYFGR
jgi:hypothetical protein